MLRRNFIAFLTALPFFRFSVKKEVKSLKLLAEYTAIVRPRPLYSCSEGLEPMRTKFCIKRKK